MKYHPHLKGCNLVVALCSAILSIASIGSADIDPGLQQQRAQVLAAGRQGVVGLPRLIGAMKSGNALVRRAAVRGMGEIGAPATGALRDALKNDADALVRRTALHSLLHCKGVDAVSVLQTALADSSAMVRVAAVQLLAGMRPYSPSIAALLKKAEQDPSTQVGQIAAQALWPFHGDAVSLRDKPAFKDHQLVVAQTIALPLEGWRFQKDIAQTGHEHNWFGVDFDDGSWSTISIGQDWDGQIGGGYDGVAWYRRTFTLPEKPAQVGTDIVFDGVDESAWVWINGQYLGQHDIGPDGWDKRFAMDAGDVLKWGQANQITVRVLNRQFAGGIWKPVYLQVLRQ